MPGVEVPSPELDAVLSRCLERKGAEYSPRTEHLEPNSAPTFTNRLICETSPYLLQHAHNPVNWYPWSNEAFERARERNVPVLLSVGYSTCHWCHVMERESSEALEIATYINENFVAIKVDREERPDVDDVYMTAVQMLTGRGGWPMTVVLTPDREPFFGGTYFPPRAGARGRRGFLDILQELSRRYRDEPDAVVAEARQLSERISQASGPSPAEGVPSDRVVARTVQAIAASFDPVYGGFGGAPKFPRPVTLELMLRYHRRTGDEAVLRMVTETLDHMARGGLYDQVGGGFHRYSTDQRWLVPHFEKMLYDNAQLAIVYLEGWQVTDRSDFRRIVEETLDYVAREMTSPSGGFYSATDADSPTSSGEQEEGWFFTWTEDELEGVLESDDAALAKAVWGTSARGNFEGRNILHLPSSMSDTASRLGLEEDVLLARLNDIREQLYAVRRLRPAPHLDDKVLTSWNGLMISAFARSGFALDRDDYLDRARASARFVLDHLRTSDGRLLRSHREDEARHDAVLDDYAFFIAGLLDLFEADADPQWLRHALALQQQLDERYRDAERGGYFLTATDSEQLLARPRPDYDGAEPSGNSVAALNLLRLAELTLDDAFRERAEEIFAAFGNTLSLRGSSAPLMVAALDQYHDQALEVVIVEHPTRDAEALVEVLRSTYLPQIVTAIGTTDELGDQTELIPFVEHKVAQSGHPTAYVCRRSNCELPTSDPQIFQSQLARIEPYTAPVEPIQVVDPAALPDPWEYDSQRNRHWHPGHGHWHDGPPPQGGR